MHTPDHEPPFEGGAQPVPQHPEPVPEREGWSVGQIVVILLSVLTLLAALVWFFK